MTTQGIVVVLLALVGSGGISGYFATRPARSTREGALIDQYQERYAEQEARAEKQDERIEKQDERLARQDKQIRDLGSTVRAMQARELDYRGYMYQLVRHIEEGAGPPPPDMPSSLYTL